MANSVDPDQTAIGAVCSGSTLFASILNSSVMVGYYREQTPSADDILDTFFLGALRVKSDHTDGLAKNNSDNVLFFSLLIGLSVDFLRGWHVHVRVVCVRVCACVCVRAFMCVLL